MRSWMTAFRNDLRNADLWPSQRARGLSIQDLNRALVRVSLSQSRNEQSGDLCKGRNYRSCDWVDSPLVKSMEKKFSEMAKDMEEEIKTVCLQCFREKGTLAQPDCGH